MKTATLIRGIRERGGDLFIDGDAVRFRGAESLLTDKLLIALREHKAEIAEILAAEPPPPDPIPSGRLRIADFANTSRVVRLWSEVLGEEVYFVGDRAEFDPTPGVQVYHAAELETFLGCSPEKLRELHDIKKQFA